jgi:hypothetical protein
VSSALFGLAHAPLYFRAAASLEAMLGLYFTLCLWYSNFNLAVPILIHSFYDFYTIFSSWWLASYELSKTVIDLKDRSNVMPYQDTERFKDSCKTIFNILDLNRDGEVDKTELILAQKLLK